VFSCSAPPLWNKVPESCRGSQRPSETPKFALNWTRSKDINQFLHFIYLTAAFILFLAVLLFLNVLMNLPNCFSILFSLAFFYDAFTAFMWSTLNYLVEMCSANKLDTRSYLRIFSLVLKPTFEGIMMHGENRHHPWGHVTKHSCNGNAGSRFRMKPQTKSGKKKRTDVLCQPVQRSSSCR